MIGALIGAGVGLLMAVMAGAYGWRRAMNRTPAGVVRLLDKPGSQYTVRLRGVMAGNKGTWNPARPWGARNYLYGPGLGTYRLDENGQVSLDWQPDRGQRQQLVGPIPAAADPDSPAKRRARRALRLVFVTYLLFAAVGLALGFELTSGTSTHRPAIGAFGAVAGLFLAYVVLLAVIGTVRVRRGNQHR